MLPSLLFLTIGQQIPRPEPTHREWGPAPPVAPYGEAALPSEYVVLPIVFPVLGQPRWDNGYGNERTGFKHTGIDIRAPKMTPVVAPFAGIIGIKQYSFWIYGDNGYATLGTHLNDDNLGTNDNHGDRDLMFAPGLRAGQHVAQGQFIGYVGMSGDATAPHLHFEIYAPGQGRIQSRIRNPFPSLKAARILTAPIPTLVNSKDIPKAGEEKLEGCVRKLDEATGELTLILLHRQTGGGPAVTITRPTWRKIKLEPDEIKELGGWSVIKSYSPDHIFSFIIQAKSPAVAQVTRLGLPAGVNISIK